jgi:hypothetical protein
LEEQVRATLHIEHAITNFATWKAAFDRFAPKRLEAGVTAERLYQPADDPAYVLLQLDFPTVQQAEGFRQFLEARIWSSTSNSPGLAGVPKARVLIDTPTSGADDGSGDGEIFYTSQNGDRWFLVTDNGGRKFVRHVSNPSSGGAVDLIDLQSFLDREPHSPQNQALAKFQS